VTRKWDRGEKGNSRAVASAATGGLEPLSYLSVSFGRVRKTRKGAIVSVQSVFHSHRRGSPWGVLLPCSSLKGTGLYTFFSGTFRGKRIGHEKEFRSCSICGDRKKLEKGPAKVKWPRRFFRAAKSLGRGENAKWVKENSLLTRLRRKRQDFRPSWTSCSGPGGGPFRPRRPGICPEFTPPAGS